MNSCTEHWCFYLSQVCTIRVGTLSKGTYFKQVSQRVVDVYRTFAPTVYFLDLLESILQVPSFNKIICNAASLFEMKVDKMLTVLK